MGDSDRAETFKLKSYPGVGPASVTISFFLLSLGIERRLSMRIRRRRAATALLLIISVLEVVRALSRRTEQRRAHPRWRHPVATLRSQDCDVLRDGLVITQFLLRYGNMAGAGTSLEIDIKMCPACGGMNPGDSIWVELPGFSRQNVQSVSDAMFAQPLVTEGNDAQFFASASWHAETSTLKFLCSERTRNGKRYILNVPLSSGLTLPVQGVRIDDPLFYYTDSCNGGPREPEAVLQSNFQPIGYFTESTIDFSPREAGATSQISISLTPAMLIQAQELILVALPRFRCQPSAPCALRDFDGELRLMSNATASFTAHSEWTDGNIWDGGSIPGTLSVRLNRPVEAGDTATIIIGKSVGLAISALGINANDPTLTGTWASFLSIMMHTQHATRSDLYKIMSK